MKPITHFECLNLLRKEKAEQTRKLTLLQNTMELYNLGIFSYTSESISKLSQEISRCNEKIDGINTLVDEIESIPEHMELCKISSKLSWQVPNEKETANAQDEVYRAGLIAQRDAYCSLKSSMQQRSERLGSQLYPRVRRMLE